MRIHVHQLVVIAVALFFAGEAMGEREPQVLFSSNETVKAVISAPWGALRRNDVEKPWPANLSWVDEQGQTQSLEITVERRGISRQRVCKFPPIRIRFGERVKDDGLFKGQKSLKMVTHCQDGDRYQQFYMVEMLAYRIFNLISDYGFRVRALEVTYHDVDRGESPDPYFAFLIEDDKAVARRKGLKKLDVQRTAPDRLDPLQASQLALFQMMIGNLDWSPLTGPDESCCHNVKLIGTDPQTVPVFPIAYDFDSTGLVDPPYAVPPESLPVRSLRTRMYRGYCAHNSTLDEARQQILALRPDIEALFANEPGLNDRTRKKSLKYLESFFDTLADERDFQKEVVDECRG